MNVTDFERIDEVPMNPGAYQQAVETGAEQGIQIGFEFEVCIPAKIIDRMRQERLHSDEHSAEILQDLDLLDIEENFKLKAPVEFNGKKFTKINNLAIEWLNVEREKVLRTAFETLPIAQKKQVLADYEKRYNIEQRANKLIGQPESTERKLDYLLDAFLPLLNNKYQSVYVKIRHAADVLKFFSDIFGITTISQILKSEVVGVKPQFSKMLRNLYLDASNFENGSEEIKSIIEPNFGKTIVFNRYHQSTKKPGIWYIEPDVTIRPNGDDYGLEIVTPPLPLKDGVDAFKKFYNVAAQHQFYTSKENSTGLHINISIPEKLDVLKLAVFIGEDHLLQSWGREDNEYIQPLVNSIKEGDRGLSINSNKGFTFFSALAKRFAKEHMSSISFNGKYVSFRHAGGDYLNDPKMALDTIGVFVRAMLIASNPNSYRKEYLAKLYKILEPGREVERKGNVLSTSLIGKYKNTPIPAILTIVASTKPTANLFRLYKQKTIDYDWVSVDAKLMPKYIKSELIRKLVNLAGGPPQDAVALLDGDGFLIGVRFDSTRSDSLTSIVFDDCRTWNKNYYGKVMLDILPTSPLHKAAMTSLINDIKHGAK